MGLMFSDGIGLVLVVIIIYYYVCFIINNYVVLFIINCYYVGDYVLESFCLFVWVDLN